MVSLMYYEFIINPGFLICLYSILLDNSVLFRFFYNDNSGYSILVAHIAFAPYTEIELLLDDCSERFDKKIKMFDNVYSIY